MVEDNENLDEIIVVGYTQTTKRDLISSVSNVKTAQISNLPVTNVTQGLAGRSPGLIVTASGGGINSTPAISIRGGGEPLYIIDGIVRTKTDFANLSPDDIKEVSILKDASATAIYGSRASNGIVQVTTNSGESGKVKVEYDFNLSYSQPSIWPQKMQGYDRAYYANLARTNDGLDPLYTDEAIQAMRDGSDPEHFSNTDWRKLVLRDWAPQTKNTVRVSGGNDSNNYYMSLGNIYQNSLYRSNTHWMKRTNFRIADNAYIKEIGLHINAAIDGYTQRQTHPYTSTSSSYYGVFSHINDKMPVNAGVNKYGLPTTLADNPVAETASDAGYIRNTNNVINGKGDLVWDCLWVDGLKIRLSSNYRYYSNKSKQWRKDAAQYDWDSTTPQYANTPQLYHESDTGYAYTNQIFADYYKRFGQHTISALFGYENYYEKTETYWEQRVSYNFDIDQISIGPEANQSNGGEEAELGRAAIIGQLKYNYGGRYLAEFSWRHDGSDYFAPGKRWGDFYSGSLGWRVSEEEFFRPLIDRNIFNNLKIRASYGETGLDSSAGRFAYLTSYSLSTNGYVVNGSFVPTFSEGSQLASPDLTWYTTRQTDVGVDFASLNSRLYGSIDYFYYSTKGYLVAPTGQSYLNTVIGVGMPKVKSDSEYRRAGWEFQLGWRDNIGDFIYDVSGNFTWYQSMWARIADESESSYMNPYTRSQQQKQNYYSSSLLHALGFYQSSDEIINSAGWLGAIATGNMTAGDIRYEDTNGDGQITSADYRRRGHQSTPHGQFGINLNASYKGFYFGALFQGATSFDLYIPGALAMQTYQSNVMPVIFDYQTNFWTPDNRNADYPRLSSNTGANGNNNYVSSDFWLIDGKYIRLKDIQFGYDFKYKLLKNVKWLSRAKVGVSGQNIFTISKATKYGMDPELSSTYNYGYPVERTLAFTLNLGF
jgi:TonB-linked SusC/RagA family outer membrane protein